MKKLFALGLCMALLLGFGGIASAETKSTAKTCDICGRLSISPNPIELSYNAKLKDPRQNDWFQKTAIAPIPSPLCKDGKWYTIRGKADEVAIAGMDEDGNGVLFPVGVGETTLKFVCPHGVSTTADVVVKFSNVEPTIQSTSKGRNRVAFVLPPWNDGGGVGG